MIASLSLLSPPLQAQGFPPTPTNARTTNITQNSVTFAWTKSPGATSYQIVNFAFTDVHNLGDVDSYTLTGLSPDTVYTYFIRAKNSHGFNDFPAQVDFSTLAAPKKSDESGSASKSYKPEPTPTPTPTPTPIPQTLRQLPPDIQVSNWVDGAQGRRVGAVGVGRADLINQGILDAVDVWSYVTPGVEVCFGQQGRIVFLDAAYAPRKLFDLPAYQRDGLTCTTIDRAGTVVLLRADSPPTEPTQPAQSQPQPSQSLSNCQVRPWANVKFRQSPPGGAIIGVTARRDWLPASEKRYGYFKVRLWDVEGWVSGAYVYTRGDCGS